MEREKVKHINGVEGGTLVLPSSKQGKQKERTNSANERKNEEGEKVKRKPKELNLECNDSF